VNDAEDFKNLVPDVARMSFARPDAPACNLPHLLKLSSLERTMIRRHCEACMTVEPTDRNPGTNTGKYSEANQRGD
jgi:hypothetical protein